ncbi:MAG TPA: dephospho-CoA kinase [Bryobacteraceae bacterium]|jgi:dephospho-CoA kinase|nr:dephospho-CoA kinase [Bryobacteraceae bacterium]
MLLVGLTGGYATGKSFVASDLERRGCHLIYADKLGHQVLLPGGEAYAQAIATFGNEVLANDGSIDRKKLGAIVFEHPEELAKLTAIVHPAVFRLEEKLIAQYLEQDPSGIVVIEAAILIESGRAGRFDRLILTTCDEETQIRRGMRRDGVTREQALARIARQIPLEEKRPFAHFVIDTSGTKEDTVRQLDSVFEKLKMLAEAGGIA